MKGRDTRECTYHNSIYLITTSSYFLPFPFEGSFRCSVDTEPGYILYIANITRILVNHDSIPCYLFMIISIPLCRDIKKIPKAIYYPPGR